MLVMDELLITLSTYKSTTHMDLKLLTHTHTHTHIAESYSSELTNSTSSGDLSHYEVHMSYPYTKAGHVYSRCYMYSLLYLYNYSHDG